MDDRMAELYNKIEKIVEYKNDIETIQGKVLWILKEGHLIRNWHKKA